MRVPLAGLAVLLLSVPADAAAPRTHEVVIDKMKFGAMPAGMRAGDTIVWVNKDMFRHTATVRGAFDVDLPANTRKAVVVKRSGTMAVICRYHPGMKAMLKVAK